MIKFITTAIAGLALSFSVCAQDKKDDVNAALPNTTIVDLRKDSKSKTVPFNTIVQKDKVTVISFWATWCVPCVSEIKEIRKKLPDWKKEADFEFITISVDAARDKAKAMNYAISQKWDFPYYIDQNSDLMRSLSFDNVPFMLVVDKNGKIVYRHSGYELGGEDEVFETVKKYANL